MREGWKKVSLSELGFVGRGKSRHRPRNANFLFGDRYPFIQTADVKAANYKITSFTTMYSEDGLKQSKLWPKNTLCITIAANIADSSILAIEACFPDSVIGFIADDNKSDVRFVKYLFDLLQVRIKQISQGAAQDNLSLEKLETIKFEVPELPTQRKIASILSGYDNLIENNLKRIKLLEEKAQLTYEEWFVKMRFPGYETAKFDKVTGLPEGWKEKNFGELTETMQYGYTESASNEPVGPKFLRITDIVGFNINWENVPYCLISDKEKSKYLLREGDIVVARTGATVGYAKRINKNCPEAVFASYLIRLKLKSEIDDVLMGVYVESKSFLKMVQNMAGGAAQPNANAPVLRQIEMIVPSKDMQLKFRHLVIEPVGCNYFK
ncbi:restriction endonuclease subunit S [Flavobacterium psychroterrae]|uniref:Restriction endonuclease subunit S n=1 Tax=Flavobacterium psychroterrae TaxID=2133767 RepID=A0ABS5PI02_9FLAO|nr:restriction endonuclease subunit S [Flavobacterium psychroterrae]MBS7233513.1 restriction endonuclease subunit S [Flavobacterium psychroterrae]